MEQMTIEQTVNEVAQALAQLETAKKDCKDVIEAALDAYFGDMPENIPRDEAKKMRASRRTERKNIKKLAKAMMRGEKDVAREEAENMADLIDQLG